MTAPPCFRRAPAGVLVLLLLAACADGVTTGAVPPQPGPPPEALAVLSCTVQVHGATASCQPYDPAAGVQANRIIGGQGVNVRLASTNLAYNAADSVFSMDVTVQNLLLQRMGTDDGVVTDGVYVFFYSGPFATNGTVEVHNPDGRAFFTSGDQPYYLWPEVLAQNAVSQAKRWEFKVPPQVASFRFYVYLQTPLLPVVLFDRSVGGNRDVWRVALDGNDLVRMTTHIGDDRDATAGGGTMAFTTFRHGAPELYSVPLAGGTETRLTTTSASEGEPALSRDGTRLAYTTDAAIGVSKVWTANADGTGRARATPTTFGSEAEPEAGPAWHPQGGRLALVATLSGSADVYDLTLGGSPTLRAGGSTAEVDPAWSPDGTRLAFTSNVTGAGDIYVLRLSDGAVTRLTSGSSTETYPTWTADGRIVYLEFLSGGATQIRWLDPDVPGSGAAVPVTGGGAPNRPHAVPF